MKRVYVDTLKGRYIAGPMAVGDRAIAAQGQFVLRGVFRYATDPRQKVQGYCYGCSWLRKFGPTVFYTPSRGLCPEY